MTRKKPLIVITLFLLATVLSGCTQLGNQPQSGNQNALSLKVDSQSLADKTRLQITNQNAVDLTNVTIIINSDYSYRLPRIAVGQQIAIDTHLIKNSQGKTLYEKLVTEGDSFKTMKMVSDQGQTETNFS